MSVLYCGTDAIFNLLGIGLRVDVKNKQIILNDNRCLRLFDTLFEGMSEGIVSEKCIIYVYYTDSWFM